MTWHVVHTRPHQEKRAAANLRNQDYRVWLPAMSRTRRHARKVETVQTPLFPGYLFIELDLGREKWSPINSTYGVKYILSDGVQPQILPDEFVDTLMDSVDETGAAFVDPKLHPGDTVRFISGPFSDCLAAVREMLPRERVRLLLSVLGRQVTTIASRREIVAAV